MTVKTQGTISESLAQLTERQRAMLNFIIAFRRENDASPTFRDFCTGLSISSTSVVLYNLDALVDRGFITRKPGKFSRGISLTPAGQAVGEAEEAKP